MSEVDAVRIREFLFNPQTPDYAFLTEEEVAEAFGAKSGTIRNWRPRGFPDPIDVPGKVAYDVGSIRAWLKRLTREATSANKKKPILQRDGNLVGKTFE